MDDPTTYGPDADLTADAAARLTQWAENGGHGVRHQIFDSGEAIRILRRDGSTVVYTSLWEEEVGAIVKAVRGEGIGSPAGAY